MRLVLACEMQCSEVEAWMLDSTVTFLNSVDLRFRHVQPALGGIPLQLTSKNKEDQPAQRWSVNLADGRLLGLSV